jgi:hypothetical protein
MRAMCEGWNLIILKGEGQDNCIFNAGSELLP